MKYVKYILFGIIINLFIININALDFDISSKNAILYNLNDNTILYELNKDEQVKVASLTKIMTIIVAIENIDNINQKIILNSNVFGGLVELHAAVVGFSIGEEVTYKDLLYGALLASGADAVNGLTINISGSEEIFVKLMNDKVDKLNLKNTHFVNATGLDIDDHYSSVQDIAIILKYALKNKTFKEIYETYSYTTSNNKHTVKNSLNKAISTNNIDMPYINGSKSGYTGAAKRCLASTSTYNGVDYLLVTTGSETSKGYIYDTKEIYEYFFNNFSYKNIVKKGDLLVSLNTKNAKEDIIKIYAPNTIKKYISNDTDLSLFKLVYDGPKIINTNLNIGDKIGNVTIYYNSNKLDVIPLYLSQGLTFSYYKYLIEHKIVIFVISILIILVLIKMVAKKGH